MSEAKHTPGPWSAHPEHNGPDAVWDVLFGDDAWNIAEVYPHVLADPSAEANARLIAAAPDLLAALKMILPEIKHDVVRGRGLFSDLQHRSVEAAIAKAEGAVMPKQRGNET